MGLRPFDFPAAYSAHIFGSILGVIGFAAVSSLEAAPPVWFGIGSHGVGGVPGDIQFKVDIILAVAWLIATVIMMVNAVEWRTSAAATTLVALLRDRRFRNRPSPVG